MADRRLRRKRAMWPWLLLAVIIVILIWLFLSPTWRGQKVYKAPLGIDVRDLKREPVPPPQPGRFDEFGPNPADRGIPKE